MDNNISTEQQGTFANCIVSFNGTRDPEVVEKFLAAANAYKTMKNITDEDSVKTVQLILRDNAAAWWNRVKESIRTWAELQSRLRNKFASKRQAFEIYHDIFRFNQREDELTEPYVAKMRDLFEELPDPLLSESQQLDMIYAHLSNRIRSELSRESVKNFHDLLKEAKRIEQVLLDNNTQYQLKLKAKKPKCAYCRFPGHSVEVCRRKAKDISNGVTSTAISVTTKPTVAHVGTQMPAPSDPKFYCFGCGAPNMVRSKCQTCLNKPRVEMPYKKIYFN